MENYSKKEQSVIDKMLEDLFEDTSLSIDFLVECFLLDRDEVDELGCEEIFSLVESEISNYDFDALKDLVKGFNFEDFDVSMMNIDNEEIAKGTMRQPCNNPCPSCPYTKNAVKGDFGGNDASEYANAIHLDTVVACHSRTKHNKKTQLPDSENDVTICTGHIVSQIKSCKSSLHPDGSKAHVFIRSLENFEKLKENALAFDFKSYHGLD